MSFRCVCGADLGESLELQMDHVLCGWPDVCLGFDSAAAIPVDLVSDPITATVAKIEHETGMRRRSCLSLDWALDDRGVEAERRSTTSSTPPPPGAP